MRELVKWPRSQSNLLNASTKLRTCSSPKTAFQMIFWYHDIILKSFLDFIQLSLFYIDPIARSSRRARAPANKTGRKGPITKCDTWGSFPFPENATMLFFPYSILTFTNTSKQPTYIWQKNCTSRSNKLNNTQLIWLRDLVLSHLVVRQVYVTIIWNLVSCELTKTHPLDFCSDPTD